jgi:hypothetical protein
MPLDRPDLFFSKNYDYTSEHPLTGFIPIGSGADGSGLYRDDSKMSLANEFDGMEKVTEYDVRGNVILGSGTATYAKYDA